MTTHTHSDLVAAVEGRWAALPDDGEAFHLDTLAAILNLSADSQEYESPDDMGRGYALAFRMVDKVVVDALTRMGAL